MKNDDLVFVAVILLIGIYISHDPAAAVDANCSNKQTLQDAHVQLRKQFSAHPAAEYKLPPDAYGGPSSRSVNVSVAIYRIVGVDEIQQVLTLVGQILVEWWLDTPTMWDPQDFCNLTRLHVPTADLWSPTLLYQQTADPDNVEVHMPSKLEVRHDGKVTATEPSIYSIFCHLDLADFPFDTHRCNTTIIEINDYDVLLGDLSYFTQVLDTLAWPDGEWMLEDSGCDNMQVCSV